MLEICSQLVRFYDVMQPSPRFLGEGAKAEMAGIGLRLPVVYAALARGTLSREEKLWKVVPKLHMFVHLCQWQCQEHGNPRFFWTYADEDMVGRMAEVAKTCHPRSMAVNALFKWLILAFRDGWCMSQQRKHKQ